MCCIIIAVVIVLTRTNIDQSVNEFEYPILQQFDLIQFWNRTNYPYALSSVSRSLRLPVFHVFPFLPTNANQTTLRYFLVIFATNLLFLPYTSEYCVFEFNDKRPAHTRKKNWMTILNDCISIYPWVSAFAFWLCAFPSKIRTKFFALRFGIDFVVTTPFSRMNLMTLNNIANEKISSWKNSTWKQT